MPRLQAGRVRVRCSGWRYRSWRGRFYPQSLPASRWLQHYASTFETVEGNDTGRYSGSYPSRALEGWDVNAAAVQNARTLAGLVA